MIKYKVYSQFYKERELLRILQKLVETLYKAHLKNIAHQNICTVNLLLNDDKKDFKIAGWGNGCLVYKGSLLVKKKNNIKEKRYLAPEIYENFSKNSSMFSNKKCTNFLKIDNFTKKPEKPEKSEKNDKFEKNNNEDKLEYDPFQADVYSLGLVTLEMMGVTPDEDFLEVRIMSKGTAFDFLQKNYPNIKDLVLRMVENDPKLRISLKELGKSLLKLEKFKENNENIEKMLPNESNFLKLHQKFLNETDEFSKLRNFETKAYGYYLIGNITKSIELSKELLCYRSSLCENKSILMKNPEIFTVLDHIGSMYFVMNNYEQALQYYEESYEAKKTLISFENSRENSKENSMENSPKNLQKNSPKNLQKNSPKNLQKNSTKNSQKNSLLQKTSLRNSQNSKENSLESLSNSSFYIARTYFSLDQLLTSLSFLDKSAEYLLETEKDQRLPLSQILSWKGLILSRLKRHKEALKVLSFIAKLREELYEKEKTHSSIADTYSDIAIENLYLNDKKNAINFFEKALFMRKIVYRTFHPEIAASLNNLGSLYDDLGEYNKALNFYEDSLRILQRLDPSDPEIARIYNNIAGIYHMKKDPISSAEFYEKSLDNFSKNHPYMAKSMLGLGNNAFDKGFIEESYEYYMNGLMILNRIDFEEVLDLARLKIGLGNCYRKMRKYELGLESYKKALVLLENLEEFKEREIADLYSNMGFCYGELGVLDKSKEMFEKCLEIRKKVLQGGHVEISYAYGSLAQVYRRMGDGEGFKRMWEMGFEIKKRVFGEGSQVVESERRRFEREMAGKKDIEEEGGISIE